MKLAHSCPDPTRQGLAADLSVPQQNPKAVWGRAEAQPGDTSSLQTWSAPPPPGEAGQGSPGPRHATTGHFLWPAMQVALRTTRSISLTWGLATLTQARPGLGQEWEFSSQEHPDQPGWAGRDKTDTLCTQAEAGRRLLLRWNSRALSSLPRSSCIPAGASPAQLGPQRRLPLPGSVPKLHFLPRAPWGV